MATSSIRIRRRLDGQGIQGKVNFLATEGLLVNYDPDDLTTPSLQKADGTKGFALMRGVVALETLENQIITDQVFPNRSAVKNPSVVGDNVSTSRLLEAELEGPDLVLASGTGAISGGTAVNAELSTNEGRLSVKQSGEEVVAILRGHLSPEDADNATRILVEFV